MSQGTIYDWEYCDHQGIGQPGCPICDCDPGRKILREVAVLHKGVAELRADRARALRAAYALTDDTQTVEEAVSALVRQVLDARVERDEALNQLQLARDYAAGLSKLARERNDLRAALRALVSAVSAWLARGEDTTPGDFDRAWREACGLLEKEGAP